ncbi:hypothetical protein [Pontiella agarivorans]|uniref:Fibronectin type-III domain-containing protein n=1 Tax=Pontiella agarivorans TaxID=3038953 RepID=A0ABU5MTP9_9BACT|nr:hypothetical protein [Pontiella agarivorans]MDZ8117543.1 hypothetical protein [Pontiella agarivorans]
MKKWSAFLIGAAVVGSALISSAQVVWQEDFESSTNGATSGNNQTLYNTVFQTANTAASVVTNAPPEFTLSTADGGTNCVLLSVGANNYTSVRSSATISGFSANAADSYKFSFDVYIPSAVSKAVGDVNPRLEASGTAGNGVTLDAMVETGPGQFHIEYTGSCGDIINGNPPADTIRPFIGIDQAGVAVENMMYMDNIHFEIIPYVPPVEVVSGSFIDTGFTATDGYSDGDLAGQTNWAQTVGSAPNAFSVINSGTTGEADTLTAGNHSTNTGNAVYWADATLNEAADAWEGYVDFKLTMTQDGSGTIYNQDVFAFGITSDTTNALNLTTNDAMALMTVKVRGDGRIVAMFADGNNDEDSTRLDALLPGTESGWDITTDFETDLIRYNWKIRKTTEFGTYQATASLSNLTAGVAHSNALSKATSVLKTKDTLFNSPLVHFTMGHYYKAQINSWDGLRELVNVELEAARVTHSTNNVSAPIAPGVIVAEGSDRTVTLFWEPILEVTGYDVLMAPEMNGEQFEIASGLTDPEFTDSPRFNGQTNWYTVRANFSTGSAYSDEVPGAAVASLAVIDMDGTRNDWTDSTSDTFYLSQAGSVTNGEFVYLDRTGATPMIANGETSGGVTYNGYTLYGLTQIPSTNGFRNFEIGNSSVGQRLVMGSGWDANSPQQLAYIEINDMDWGGTIPENIDATGDAASIYLSVRSYSDGVGAAYVYPAIRNGSQWYVGDEGINLKGIKTGFGDYTVSDVMSETWNELNPQPSVPMASEAVLADNSVLTNITAMGWFGNKIAYLSLSQFKVTVAGETPSTEYWMRQYGSVTNLTEDTDGDGLVNIKEYAFGGDPEATDSFPANFPDGNGLPTFTAGDYMGTNGFFVTHIELRDPNPGIDYSLESSGNLVVPGSWAADGVWVGEAEIDYYYKSVTHFISADDAAKFIDLKVNEL